MSQEQAVWSGTPSQVVNLGTYILCILFLWLVIPAFILLWKWLVVRNTQYELTTQRLRLRTGVLNKETSALELYRVKDFTVDQPLFLRLFSVANIILETSDKSHPTVVIRAVPDAEALASTIREHVEVMRRGRVREVDMA
ncbi:MAG: PH domain-containing protein [Oxalobacteraceae bacterium]|nr:PH domain-containing protein [Oxalobacteraceae bacterium]